MSLNRWIMLCCVLALPCAGIANLLIYLGPPDSTPSPDRDGDGLLDAWEQDHFGHLDFDADDDSDHDGITNGDEFARGTLPNDSTSAAITLFVSSSVGNSTYDGLSRAWDGSHGPKPSINTALSASLPGDTIHVLSGTYPEDVDLGGRDVTVTGEGLLKGTP